MTKKNNRDFDIPDNEADIYKKAASKMFNVKYEDVAPEQRRTAKAIVFPILYGPQEEAQKFIEGLYKEKNK
jgi:DNA polymerase I-like protein with 3'-5' exonuclease and polymerase domains